MLRERGAGSPSRYPQDPLHRRGRDRTSSARGGRANLTPVVAELGGKSANVIFEDADLDAGGGDGGASGPTDAVWAELCLREPGLGARVGVRHISREVPRHIGSAKVGDPLDPTVFFGPVISGDVGRPDPRRDRQAVAQTSGELLLGGKRIGGDLAQGYYIEPTVFGDVDNASALAQDETFGPVVSSSDSATKPKRCASPTTPVRAERIRPDPRPHPCASFRAPAGIRVGVDQPARVSSRRKDPTAVTKQWLRPYRGRRRTAGISAGQEYSYRHGLIADSGDGMPAEAHGPHFAAHRSPCLSIAAAQRRTCRCHQAHRSNPRRRLRRWCRPATPRPRSRRHAKAGCSRCNAPRPAPQP